MYPEYKDSGVNWIGNVPKHWNIKPLKWLAEQVTEKAIASNFQVGLENIEGWSGRFIETEGEFSGDGIEFRPEDILFGKLRPYLAKAWLSDKAGQAVGDFFVLRPNAIHGEFLHKYILTPTVIDNLNASTIGAKMPRVGWEDMAALAVALPPREEQTQIARFLDHETARIDALIEEQQRLIELLKEKRQAVISLAVTKGLDPTVPMKDSGVEWLGEVPTHWRARKVKRLFTQSKRQGYSDMEVLSVYRDYGVIKKNSRDDNNNKTPDDLSLYQLVERGDLVVNKMKAWQGSLGVSEHSGITSPDYVVYRPHHDESPRFIHHSLRASHMPNIYLAISNGIRPSQWRIEPDKFEQLVLFLPDKVEQLEIAAYLEVQAQEMDELMQCCEQAVELFTERRAALISAAVTGKIDVRSWQPTASTQAPESAVAEVV
ncbi:restriction endonuclease subunit S [Pseudomonas panipatensis]